MRTSHRLLGILTALPLLPAAAQQPAAYKLPPPDVVALVDAPATPSVVMSPDAQWTLLVEPSLYPPIAEIARPWIGLAGIRVDPATNAPRQPFHETGMVLRNLEGTSEHRIEIAAGSRVMSEGWSPTSDRVWFTIATDHGTELWVADVASAKPMRLTERLNPVLGDPIEWTPDGSSVVLKLAPEKRGQPPQSPLVPAGPIEQETSGTTTPVRTYEDLLQNPHDEALFEYYGASQIARVDLASGKAITIGKPGVYAQVSLSPDGHHLLVERLHAPWSYVFPADQFPRTIEVWSLEGTVERSIADVPLGEHIPQEGVRTGPREVGWQASAPATLVWVEALDGGDPKQKAEKRDRWMRLDAPFHGEPAEMFRLAQRATGLMWMRTPTQVLATEYDRDRRWTRTFLFDLGDRATEPRVIDDRSVNDKYGDPGRPLTTIDERGQRIVRQDGEWIYRVGAGAAPEGARPFLDRVHLRTLKSDRLWRCEAGKYENVVAIVSSATDGPPVVVTAAESATEPPNWRVRDLAKDTVRAITSFPDPQPSLRGVHQELVKYKRKDGVDLSATLYLPKEYRPGTRLPLVVWAYPLEYSDQKTAGQVGTSPWRFVRIRGASQLLFVTQGYAVLDGATMPVVGDPEHMNDTFVEQIVASAQAAIDKAVEMGVADRDHVGVGGHSYGAFMTANLLAHSDLFKAGIARSGAYNRTLTPFGFQSERRTLWEASDAYVKLSPFFFAQQLHAPLLLVHGQKDSNPGTFPIQSERMFQAIKGNGGTARLVLLPEEDHGYYARESVLHVAAEMIDWFDRYVKAAPANGSSHAAEAGR